MKSQPGVRQRPDKNLDELWRIECKRIQRDKRMNPTFSFQMLSLDLQHTRNSLNGSFLPISGASGKHGCRISQTITRRHILASFVLAFALPVSGIGDIQSTTQTIAVNVAPNGKLSLPSNVNLQSADTRFGGNLSGTLTVSYWARTSDGGGGSVTVQAGSEFMPAGGPSVSSVTYLCSGATLGTGCSGSHTLATSTQTPLVSLPGGACTGGGSVCSTQEPNTVLLSLSAPNNPQYKTGSYSALITFTISTL
jgi:hypothetical protein